MFPLPDRKETLDPIRFSLGAGLVHRFGRESYLTPILSVVELVENSYDDAEQVVMTLTNLRTGTSFIMVEDNGNGRRKKGSSEES